MDLETKPNERPVEYDVDLSDLDGGNPTEEETIRLIEEGKEAAREVLQAVG